jgi:hypothetical protein
VTRIEVRLKTGNVDGAGTDCRVYLGIGGREFNLDIRDVDDRKKNSNNVHALGEVGNVFLSAENDPRTPLALTVEDTSRHPVYIRMSDRCGFPAGGWNLDYAEVRVNPGLYQMPPTLQDRAYTLSDLVQCALTSPHRALANRASIAAVFGFIERRLNRKF